MAIGDEILLRTADSYRRIRNTLRFLLGNLADFKKEDLLPVSQLLVLDRYFLEKIALMQKKARKAYASYEFQDVARSLVDCCINDLGAEYLDIIKDRLYTMHPQAQARRSAQTTLYYIFLSIIHQLTPLLPFTAEDAWQHWLLKDSVSILLNTWPDMEQHESLLTQEDRAQCESVLTLKKNIQPKLEYLRQKGIIGSSLEAKVFLRVPQDDTINDWVTELKFIFLVSQVIVEKDSTLKEVFADVAPLEDSYKCDRCWHRVEILNDQQCSRCESNQVFPGELRYYG
jgi:isoleucyl-tRNA synthetase